MKTICIYHSRDLDGWMSAAIVKKWFETPKGIINSIYEWPSKKEIGKNGELLDYIKQTSEIVNELWMLGWDYGDIIPDLSEYNKVVMCDVSFSKDKIYKIANKTNLIWIDHHNSAIKEIDGYTIKDEYKLKGLRDTNFAACELTWKYFFPNEEMPEIVRLLGRYDCFGHKGTNEELKVLEFQYSAREEISNYEEAYDALCEDIDHNITKDWIRNGSIIYNYLCTEAEQIYKKAFPIELKEDMSKTNLQKLNPFNNNPVNYRRKFLCVNHERFNPINFGIDYHKEDYDGFACFWLKDGKWTFSLYNDNGEVDCSQIAKQYGGGGHRGASGFVLDFDKLKQIIK